MFGENIENCALSPTPAWEFLVAVNKFDLLLVSAFFFAAENES